MSCGFRPALPLRGGSEAGVLCPGFMFANRCLVPSTKSFLYDAVNVVKISIITFIVGLGFI